ncbi:hypothetical protein HPB48_014387 [Haemaphysalis longicornis]|uniref:Uncharacterized protein n=1 Tax=Haemaphysalis longicornis TaxID=44386 RepID=A0A9J6GD74_HAELO|nr:hypothetical protein HPB48_014387 [Haemaphysalis longicornis]
MSKTETLKRTKRQLHDDIKVVLRPREALDITKIRQSGLRDVVLRSAGRTYDEASEDIRRTNVVKNAIVASTSSMACAQKYTTIQELQLWVHHLQSERLRGAAGGHCQRCYPQHPLI